MEFFLRAQERQWLHLEYWSDQCHQCCWWAWCWPCRTTNRHTSHLMNIGNKYESDIWRSMWCFPVAKLKQHMPCIGPFSISYNSLNIIPRATKTSIDLEVLNMCSCSIYVKQYTNKLYCVCAMYGVHYLLVWGFQMEWTAHICVHMYSVNCQYIRMTHSKDASILFNPIQVKHIHTPVCILAYTSM